jgi:hypothetical protein
MKYLKIKDFWKEGYLQEVNRRFFHPLGLAMEVNPENDKVRIQDYRDDLEGCYFAEIELDDMRKKAENINNEWQARLDSRRAALGYMIQEIPEKG